LLPALVAGWVDKALNLGPWWGNLFEGFLRLLILIAYLTIVGRIPDIKRTFMYHGAEHKTINAFEPGFH
jgi:Predicted metal-dependent enzyme